MNETYTLHYAPDNASMIVRIALDLMGASYRTELVDRATSAQKAPRYLALNPLGMIPALETREGVLFETAAILLWLSERHTCLFPKQDEPTRGDALKWLFFTSNSLHAGLRQIFYPEKFIAPEHGDALRHGLAQRLRADFAQVDRLVADPDTAFLGGEQVSILDIYVCTCLRWAQIYPPGFDKGWVRAAEYPNLMKMAARLETLPAVRAAQDIEGLGPTPFTDPSPARPKVGSAT